MAAINTVAGGQIKRVEFFLTLDATLEASALAPSVSRLRQKQARRRGRAGLLSWTTFRGRVPLKVDTSLPGPKALGGLAERNGPAADGAHLRLPPLFS